MPAFLIWLFLFILSLSFGIEIISDRVLRTPEGHVVAEGDVIVDYGEFLIFAEVLRYDPETREIFAEKGVVVIRKDGRFRISGEYAYINLRQNRGYFINAKGNYEEFYFSARRITRKGDTFEISEGEITTCPPEDKELKVCFSRSRITGKYVFSFNNRLKFFNVPIFFSPVTVFPVGKRRSGFLPPMIGQNTYNDFIYIQPFFWAISRDRDATFTFDFRNRQAKGLWIEYRQAFSLGDRLFSKLSYYLEPEPPKEWWEGRDPRTFRRNRYRLELKLKLRDWKIGLDLPSDPYFFEDVYFARKERSTPYTVSYVAYEYKGRDHLFTFNLRNYYDLTSPTNERTTNVLPEFTFYRSPKRLAGNLHLGLTTAFTNFYSEQGSSTRRLVFNPELSLPMRIFNVRNFTNLRLINNFYFGEENFSDNRVNTYLVENRTPFFRSFSLGNFVLSNTFEGVYTYSPRNFDNPQLDPADNIVKENQFKFRLNSSLSYGGRDLLNLFLEGGYNLLESYKFPTDNSVINKKLLPFRYILSVYPHRNVSLMQDSVYDANLGVLAYSVTSLGYSLNGNSFKSKIRASYLIRRNSKKEITTDQYTLSLSLSLRSFLLGGEITNDNRNNKELYSRLFLGIQGSCWALKIDFRKTYFGNKGYVNEVFLIFNIFNLRDFKLPLKRS